MLKTLLNGTTTSYFYDLGLKPVTEMNGSTWTRSYAYFGGQLLAQYSSASTYFVHQDHLGSARLVTAYNGSVCDSLDYLPFGEQVAGSSSCSSHKFTGYERDAETGLDYAFARYYNDRLGRFMSGDPLGGDTSDPQTLNRYTYVRNNPVNLTDPTGMFVPCSGSPGCPLPPSLTFATFAPVGGGGDLPINCYVGLCLCHWRGNCAFAFHECTPQTRYYCGTTPPTQPTSGSGGSAGTSGGSGGTVIVPPPPIIPPPPPQPFGPPPQTSKNACKPASSAPSEAGETIGALVNVLHVADTVALIGLGTGLVAAGVAGTGYLCVQTGGLACIAAIEAAPAFIMSGYFLAKGSLAELKGELGRAPQVCP